MASNELAVKFNQVLMEGLTYGEREAFKQMSFILAIGDAKPKPDDLIERNGS